MAGTEISKRTRIGFPLLTPFTRANEPVSVAKYIKHSRTICPPSRTYYFIKILDFGRDEF